MVLERLLLVEVLLVRIVLLTAVLLAGILYSSRDFSNLNTIITSTIDISIVTTLGASIRLIFLSL